jgi:glutamate decarboxylase
MTLQRTNEQDDDIEFRPQFAVPGEVNRVPRNHLPAGEMQPRTAFQIIHDELMLDGNARLNLATFVTTWMEPEADLLMAESADKNMIDKDEYPQTAELERRCVNILSNLWNAPVASGGVGNGTGCSTTGSSEACMLGGLAMKWRWRDRRIAAKKSHDRPNLVMGANVQVCWDKFCRYWDVEPRLVSVDAEHTHLTAEKAVAVCDENTIGVVAILGSTFDGCYEPVEEINAALDQLEADKGWDIPIHVDGASGAFIAPFIDPALSWDFRVPRVLSINTSGHKYGLVYPGVGWIIWRDADDLPKDLVFDVDYLGGSMPTFALNFSRPGAQVVAQYYNFLRLGFDGYRSIQQACRDTAMWIAAEFTRVGPFELLSQGDQLPVFAVRLRDDVSDYTVFDISDRLRMRGWLVPAYHMPPDIEDMAVLRVVVRNGFSRDLASMLIADLEREIAYLEEHGGSPDVKHKGFSH